jgi:hypothetical protein
MARWPSYRSFLWQLGIDPFPQYIRKHAAKSFLVLNWEVSTMECLL